MLKMKKGCKVPFPEKLQESYELKDNAIVANVDVDNIEKVLRHFINMHNEPLFFILELPANIKDENVIEPGMLEKTHKDIYFIDGCTQEEANEILESVGELLINDGISQFGFGCHESEDEIMIGNYNIVTILSKNIDIYKDFYKMHNIPRVDSIVTAWDTFSQNHPGESNIYELGGVDVYDIPKIFEDCGMYFYEQVTE